MGVGLKKYKILIYEMKKLFLFVCLFIVTSCGSLQENTNFWCDFGNESFRIKEVKQVVESQKPNAQFQFLYDKVYYSDRYIFTIEGRDGTLYIEQLFINNIPSFDFNMQSWKNNKVQSCLIVENVLVLKKSK